MRKFKFAVAAFMAVCALTVASCSKDGDKATAEILPGDSAAINIRYVNMTRIGQNYTLAQELFAERQKMMLDFQNQAAAKDNQLQRLYQTIQQKINNNVYLSQQSAESDQREFLNMQNQAQQWSSQRLEEMDRYAALQTMRLNDSIRSVIRDICVANHLDAVIDDTVTYYVNPRLDITDAVIEELNRRYKPAAPAALPADSLTVKKK